MFAIFDVIARPFGLLIWFVYQFCQNYGVALIIFTILVKALMLPLSIKQQKSMAKTQAVQPKLTALQEKYKFDKEKLNVEMMKLYKDNNISPMGGCLPMLLQFPIIIALYQVIMNPLKFMLGISPEVLAALQTQFFPGQSFVQPIQLATSITMDNVAMLNAKFGIDSLAAINFNFLGLNLSATPKPLFIDALWLIPIFSGLTSWLSTKVMSAQQNQNGQAAPANSTMKTMNMVMPFMSLFFTFTMPAGVGLYWVISNVVQIGQQVFLNKYVKAHEVKDSNIIEIEDVATYTGKKKKKKGKY